MESLLIILAKVYYDTRESSDIYSKYIYHKKIVSK
jgi:hypothetical protein